MAVDIDEQAAVIASLSTALEVLETHLSELPAPPVIVMGGPQFERTRRQIQTAVKTYRAIFPKGV